MPSKDTQPWTVKAFESLALILLAADLILSEGFSIDDLVWIPLYLWMILSITRKKSALARTIFTTLFVVGWIVAIIIFSDHLGRVAAFSIVEKMVAVALGAATAFHLWLLWSAPTSGWLATRHQAEPEPFSHDR